MGDSHELRIVSSAPAYQGGTYIDIGLGKHQKDENTLARLGKKQVLKVHIDDSIATYKSVGNDLLIFIKRRFGFMSLIGFSCAILVTWETALG